MASDTQLPAVSPLVQVEKGVLRPKVLDLYESLFIVRIAPI